MTDIIFKIKSADLFRMAGWLISGLLFYAASIYVGVDYPQVQVILQKLGNVTTFSFLGYWISRRALGRIDMDFYRPTDGLRLVARGIIIGCAVLAGALGL